MNRKRITLVAAVASNGTIGADGAMPWRAPSELRHFRATTAGACVLMGRKTWFSIGKPLAGRMSIVLSRNPRLRLAGCEVRASLDDALAAADERPGSEIMVVGGADVYRQCIPLADRIILSRMDFVCQGDAFFPYYGSAEWPQASWKLATSAAGAPGNIGFEVEHYFHTQSSYFFSETPKPTD